MYRKSWLIAVIMLAVGVGMGVLIRPERSQDNSNSKTDRMYRMLVPYHSWPGWSVSARAMDRISRSTSGIHTALSGPDDGDCNKQIEELELLIRNRISGVILCPGEGAESLARTVDKANSNGIPIVTMYDDVPNSARLTLITTDEKANAERISHSIFEKVKMEYINKKPARVLVCYMGPGISNQRARLEGVGEAAKKASWIEVIKPPIQDSADEKKAAEGIHAAWVREQPKGGIQIIIGLDARSAIGAISALKQDSIQPGKVLITGWDSDEDVLNGIKNGWIEATSAPNAGFMTLLALEVLEAYNLHYLYPDSLSLQEMDIGALPARINVEPIRIDQTNVDAFYRKR